MRIYVTRRARACGCTKVGHSEADLVYWHPETGHAVEIHATMVDVGDPRWRLWLGRVYDWDPASVTIHLFRPQA